MASSSSPRKRQRLDESGNALKDVVPLSVSAFSPSTRNKLSYDVFINHRGCDVKETLAKDLYEALTRREMRVFLDKEEFEPGDFIPTELEEAMRSAPLHIAIFSEKYAESPWCLGELFFMLQQTNKKFIPIFYNVQPCHFRWVAKGNGIYASAFRDYSRKRRYSRKKLQDWKEALEIASAYSGYIINSDDDWKRELENLEKRVVEMTKRQLHVSKDPLVGLEETVEDFQSKTIGFASNDDSAQIVGIVGMGGCGKTTLAKQVYNMKCFSIKSSFLYDVRDEASKNQLPELQKKLLKDLGEKVENLSFRNIQEGLDHILSCLRSVPMLVVLDDVDNKEQIDALMPPKQSLGRGSLIIITTRDSNVLTSAGIPIYEMKGLDSCKAKELFCLHAFPNRDPPEEFEHLVKMSLSICQGIPLSLKALGGQLCDKRREYWQSQLNEFSTVLPSDIKKILQKSYDALDPEDQELFLDIACFFIKERKSLVIQVWDGLGQNGVYRLEMLKNKCLLELDQENCIRMHDHLRDLGREIAKGKSPYRIWLEGQINNSSSQAKEEMQIRGIMAATTSFHSNYGSFVVGSCSSHYEPFEECIDVMKRSMRHLPLKFLILNNEVFNEKIGKLLKELVWLRWFGFDHECLPSYLPLGNLRVLELYEVRRIETLWKNNRNPPLKLRELIIQMAYYHGLQSLPKSIGSLKHLKKLVIVCGEESSISSLPDEFCELESLEHLELEGLLMLLSLPSRFGNLRELQHVTLSSLESLSCLPFSFGKLSNLTTLHISVCSSLKRLPRSFGKLSSLTTLHIYSCERLESFPDSLGSLNRLEKLDIMYAGVKSLPVTFGQLANLKELLIGSCPLRELTFRSSSASSLRSLRKISISDYSGRKDLGTSFPKISISEDCPSLETFYIQGSEELIEIETLPKTLKQLIVVDCPKLEKLPSFAYFTSLKDLKICDTKKIEKIENLEQMTSLETSRVKNGWKLPRLAGLEHIPRLRTMELSSADNISALEPCIQTMKRWPCEMVIWGIVVDVAESIVTDYTFPHLTVVHSLADKHISDEDWTLNCPKRCSSKAAIICVLFNCLCEK